MVCLLGAGIGARLTTGDVETHTPPRGSDLSAISCLSPGRCMSVGWVGSAYGVRVPFAMLSATGAWVARSPQPDLNAGDSELQGIDCPTSDSCVAVGRQETPTAFFGATAAGDRPLTASWNGTSWQVKPGLAPADTTDAELNAVSCVATTCVAVGDFSTRVRPERTLAETWDGTRWTLHLPPNPHFTEEVDDVVLQDVACVSATDCTAVGYFSYELELLGQLFAPLIYHWDGTAWHPERAVSPAQTRDTELNAVACPSSGQCVAVGLQRLPNGAYSTLVEVRDAKGWRLVPAKLVSQTGAAGLSDVACSAVDRCIAVGSIVTPTGFVSLAASWDGERWTTQRVPTPSDSKSSGLTTIDCTHAAECYAAGVYYRSSPIGLAFGARWDGAAWSVVPVPLP